MGPAKTNTKKFKCDICEKSYTSKQILAKHVDVFHKGLKNHCCDQCGKAFGRLATLRVHMLRHTGKCPFKCIYCELGFKEKRNMLKHIDRLHSDRPLVE